MIHSWLDEIYLESRFLIEKKYSDSGNPSLVSSWMRNFMPCLLKKAVPPVKTTSQSPPYFRESIPSEFSQRKIRKNCQLLIFFTRIQLIDTVYQLYFTYFITVSKLCFVYLIANATENCTVDSAVSVFKIST